MTKVGKKQFERWLLERFLEALGPVAPASSLSFRDSENPDFLLATPGQQSLGIEFSELNHVGLSSSGVPLRQEEGIRDRLCRAVVQRWDTARTPVAQVSVHLLGCQLPSREDEARIADAILAVIRGNMPTEEGGVDVTRETLRQHPVLGSLVQSVSIGRWSGLDQPYVYSPHAAFLPSLSHAVLQEAFSRKNERVLDYRRNCHTVWLVVAHHLPQLATHFCPGAGKLADMYDLHFDRTYVLDVFGKSLTEIKVHSGTGE
jgi:hypothetical protein